MASKRKAGGKTGRGGSGDAAMHDASGAQSGKHGDTSAVKVAASIHDMQNRVLVGPQAADKTSSMDGGGTFASIGIDQSWSLERFKQSVRVEVTHLDDTSMQFDLIGVDAPLANALRRILLAEVPTMAIERVWITKNTSVIQDEVLAHRLGLVPILADPRGFEFSDDQDTPTDLTALDFSLSVRCEVNPNAPPNAELPRDKYVHSEVYSSDIRWQPAGAQAQLPQPVRPVHPDILLAKLRPGQEIDVRMFAYKGMGKVHAKWSPVSTASYRLLPDPQLLQPVTGERATQLKALCPMDVFDIEDMAGVATATVARPRACTMCRECIREPQWQKLVRLTRVKDHFLFSIETTGALPPQVLFDEAIQVLIAKCQHMQHERAKANRVDAPSPGPDAADAVMQDVSMTDAPAP